MEHQFHKNNLTLHRNLFLWHSHDIPTNLSLQNPSMFKESQNNCQGCDKNRPCNSKDQWYDKSHNKPRFKLKVIKHVETRPSEQKTAL